MAEDVPALKEISRAARNIPIDRVIHDGDKVTLGGTTLTAHLTAGPHERLHHLDDDGRRKAVATTMSSSSAACAREER